jgi:hypothetical protein
MTIAVDRAALAGLWSDDLMVARGAASLLNEFQLDVRDIERYQQIMIPLITQHAAALRWWRRFHEQLKWSRVAGHYVIGPR